MMLFRNLGFRETKSLLWFDEVALKTEMGIKSESSYLNKFSLSVWGR